jgi:phosphotransferase system enzyme I (PtsI)
MTHKEQLSYQGIPAAAGLAHGRTFLLVKEQLEVPQYDISNPDGEIRRLSESIQKAQIEIAEIKEAVSNRSSSNEAEIFEAHLMILEDAAVLDKAKNVIKAGVNAEKAWMDAIEFFAQMMESIPDETMASRAVDIRDVGHRVLGHLMGLGSNSMTTEEPVVICGDDLTPSDTAGFDKDHVLAYCTAEGGPTSHTAILAKAFGLPAVVGLGEDFLSVPPETLVLVDGHKGEVVVNPSQSVFDAFIAREIEDKSEQKSAREAAQAPCVNADGERVEVVANIGGVEDAPLGVINGAEGVGLFRTEFLYLDRQSLPSEAEQIEAYRQVFQHYKGMPFVVRTLDIGGDKTIPYLDLPEELNPFLGWRGVRMLNGLESLFVTQFRALLQSGALEEVDLRIMVPMVSGLSEIKAVKALIQKVKEELAAEGKAFLDKIQFGIMVEVPSAALLADQLAPEVDFFSIGTNDLTQYTLAVDRTNSKVVNLAHPLNPAVLRLINNTIDHAHQVGKWVGLCGELAGEPLAAPILLGLSLDEFSMSPARVPIIKQVMRHLHRDACKKLAEDVLKLPDAESVLERSQQFLRDLGLDY